MGENIMSRMPVNKRMCATCPFRPGSRYANLAPDLAASARGEASRICHSTGSNAINYRTGKPERLCRGARDEQLKFFVGLGFLAEPTDAAWEAKCRKLGIAPDEKRK
jgi:hypothetical protein